jgi:hypothetical protein
MLLCGNGTWTVKAAALAVTVGNTILGNLFE